MEILRNITPWALFAALAVIVALGHMIKVDRMWTCPNCQKRDWAAVTVYPDETTYRCKNCGYREIRKFPVPGKQGEGEEDEEAE